MLGHRVQEGIKIDVLVVYSNPNSGRHRSQRNGHEVSIPPHELTDYSVLGGNNGKG